MEQLKFSMLTLGCKVNQYDSNMVKQMLEENNFKFVDFNKDIADIMLN